MSVIASKRTESPLQCYEMARSLRERISTDLIQHLEDDVHKGSYATEHNTCVTTEEAYPKYMIDYLRNDILNTLHGLIKHIVLANAIYPVYMSELRVRQIMQDYAIGYAESLRAELAYCVDVFPRMLHCMLHYADDIDCLIKAMRGWKRANNKIAKRLRGHPETDFCNVSNNGNANYNSAANVNAVSPDFVECNEDSMSRAPTMKGGCHPAG